MNYLAHAFLSNNNDDLLVGNFIADHLRGNDLSVYSSEIQKGIQLHRQIDTFTDQHELFRASKRFFYDGFEKFSGILIDIYFDHLLARNFDNYSKVSLASFSEHVYKVYSTHHTLMPKTGLGFLDYVLKNDIYTGYATLSGIERVLFHLSHRIKHNVRLDRSLPLFEAHQHQLNSNFEKFFNDARRKFLVSEN